jgi:hypothetical protein
MLALNITISGDRIILYGLQQLALDMPKTIERGLKKVVRGVHRVAMDFLNGPGSFSAPTTGKRKVKVTLPGGGYPVPVRTGNLKRLLDFLDPGKSKGGFSAGPLEALVYNSAEYARVIHDGRGSSAKYGPREYLTDALARFNQGSAIAAVLGNEVQADIAKRGLK